METLAPELTELAGDGADDPTLAADAALLEALAHPVRLRLLMRLSRAPCCVGELVDDAELLQPRVSRHLAVLRQAGIVACEADGRRRCYHLARPELVRAVLDLLEAHRASPPGAPPPGEPT